MTTKTTYITEAQVREKIAEIQEFDRQGDYEQAGAAEDRLVLEVMRCAAVSVPGTYHLARLVCDHLESEDSGDRGIRWRA